jgi:hypothetical protein
MLTFFKLNISKIWTIFWIWTIPNLDNFEIWTIFLKFTIFILKQLFSSNYQLQRKLLEKGTCICRRSCLLQPTTVLLGRPREASALGVAAIRNTTALYREPQKRLNPQWVNGLQQAPEKGLSSPPPRLSCYLLDITRVPSLALGIPLLPTFWSSSSSTLSVAMGHRTPTRWCWANPVVRGMPR